MMSRSCATDECLQSMLRLVYGNEQQQRCYTCIATQLPIETFGRIRETCPTLVNQLYGFRGQNDLMILSRYPLKNEQVWLVPGGWGKGAILSATAELPNGSELDLFCNHLIVVARSLARPYTGQYGNGKTGQEAWEEELFLQTQKLIARVESMSRDRPAIILGDMNSGHAYPRRGGFRGSRKSNRPPREFLHPRIYGRLRPALHVLQHESSEQLWAGEVAMDRPYPASQPSR